MTGLTTPSIGYKPFRYPWAYDAWLQQQRIHWLPEEVPLADDVRDWQKRLEPSEKNLLTQIFRFFTQADASVAENYVHNYMPIFKPTEVVMMLSSFADSECFDRNTELLTSEGWKRCDTLTTEDKVAQYDLQTGAITFVHPDRVVAYPYHGVMHRYKSETADICVTPNHELIIQHPTSRKVKKVRSYERKLGQNYLYPTAANVDKAEHSGERVPALVALKIAIAADGCLRGNCPSVNPASRTIDFNLTKDRKKKRLAALLTELGISCNEREKEGGQSKYTFTFPGNDAILSLKTLDFLSLEDMTPAMARALVDEIIFWDGTRSGSNRAFYSTERRAVDKFQAICVLAGISATLGVNREAGWTAYLPTGRVTSNTKTCWIVTLSDRVWRTYPYRVEEEYDDEVFCVSVPHQNIVSRRNGRIAITGNTVHIASYSHLLDTVGMPESEYTTFMQIKEMRDKYDYFSNFSTSNPREIAKTLAAFGAFTEGLQLFASFAMLLNFPRFGKMKGMGQIIAWSVRDETLHCENIIRLFHTYCAENPGLFDDSLKADIYEICKTIVEHEDAFIDLAFALGPVQGMTADEIKQYIRFIADRRLLQLHMAPYYKVKDNPLPWLDELLNAPEHTNFFENRATEYSKAATKGEWGDVF
jgi:ribonucleotide reductase beta subunit family protein with ferritin-like domain